MRGAALHTCGFSISLDWSELKALREETSSEVHPLDVLLSAGHVGLHDCHVSSSEGFSLIHSRDEETAARMLESLRDGEVCDDAEGAFLFFDWRNARLVAGTDRLGTLPIYYYCDADRLIVSTRPGAVASSLPGCAPTAQSLYNYVYFHVVPAPRSVYGPMSKLLAAQSVTLCDGQSCVDRYWQPRFSAQVEMRGGRKGRVLQDAHRELRELLKSAVAKRLPSDGRVGAFLSGGLDSSSIAGMLSEVRDDACAFAIGFEAEGYDEMPYARISAKHFGVELHELYVRPDDVVEALPDLAASFDEPFGNSSALPAYFCAKMAAREGVEVLLAGDGGDELFAGNERYAKQLVFERYRGLPTWIRRGLVQPLQAALPRRLQLARKGASFLDQASIALPERLWSYSFLEQTPPQDVFTEAFLHRVDCDDIGRGLRATYDCTDGEATLDRMLHLDWQITLADNDLRKVNLACALAGVRVEYPMLDSAMLDFSIALPSEWKLSGGELRSFFKGAMRGWLPDATLEKSKHGFGLPFGIWMREHAPLQALAYESVEKLSARGIFRQSFLKHAIEQHKTGHAAYFGELIWVLCALELWLAANCSDYGMGGFGDLEQL